MHGISAEKAALQLSLNILRQTTCMAYMEIERTTTQRRFEAKIYNNLQMPRMALQFAKWEFRI